MELQKKNVIISILLPIIAAFLLFFLKNSFKASSSGCSLLYNNHYWISSNRIVTPNGIISGAIEINDGKVISIVKEEQWRGITKGDQIVDFGEAVVMPGLIDVHAHLDDPGRDEWEGFPSGTRAAAAGGITTLIDMPLNSEPSTVSVETLDLKIKAAKNRIYVDVGFWGGLVPDNAFNATALENFLRAGVLGLKSFMCPSGINDFPMTNISHIKEGLSILAKFKRPLLVHAEVQEELVEDSVENNDGDAKLYSTYLKTRPPSMEQAAITDLLTVSEDTRVGGPSEGAHLHVVHLSDAGTSLDLLKKARARGDSLTVETCPHYLSFSAEEIPDGDTRFKCAPPIRDAENKDKLWEALKVTKPETVKEVYPGLQGDIYWLDLDFDYAVGFQVNDVDMLSSDHSPSLPSLKLLEQGNFLKAWGGISSLQYVLSATWTSGREYGVTFEQIASWWSERPAKLAGQHLKGAIAVGNYADIVAWEPETEFHLDDNHPSYAKHPSISAYMGRKLSGKVLATFVRGNLVYREGKHAPSACGTTILAQ